MQAGLAGRELAGINPASGEGVEKQLWRLAPGFIRKLKGAPVDADGAAHLKGLYDLHGLIWIDVLRRT